jgi:hypothetical protein
LAIELARTTGTAGWVPYTFSGQWDRGVKLVTKANNLNPTAAVGWYHSALHYDFFRKGEYRAAVDIVVQHPELKLLWIDMDGMRFRGRLAPASPRRALVRLAVQVPWF